MRLFLILCSLAAVAYAKPQYVYGSNTAVTDFGVPGFSSRSSSSFLGAPNAGAAFDTFQSSASQQHSFQQTAGFEAPIVHKQFFTISAPEDNDSLERTKHLLIGRPQKNYRVVFIKAPSSNNANVKLSAEYAPHEEKTAIYVLTKKDSALEVNDIATPAPTIPSKPEVFFIKYKTEQEAQHAQRTIQAEYDKIEGTSEHTNGGIGQVQSVIGSLDGGASQNVGSVVSASSRSSIFANNGDAQAKTYLPPGK